jgi:ferrous iron transport protein B
MGVSLIAGIAGKEIVVSTLSVMVQDENKAGNQVDLGTRLKNQTYSNGLPVYTPLTALSFLAFIMIYFPCLAVVITVARESGSVWWSVFLIAYTTGLAWLISFAINQTGSVLI